MRWQALQQPTRANHDFPRWLRHSVTGTPTAAHQSINRIVRNERFAQGQLLACALVYRPGRFVPVCSTRPSVPGRRIIWSRSMVLEEVESVESGVADDRAHHRQWPTGFQHRRLIARLKKPKPSTAGHAAIANRSFAAATILPGSNPNFCCSSFNGAEAPKVRIPMMWPVPPT